MPRGPYRILAVDDVASNLMTLRAILPASEFHFTGCGSAQELFARDDLGQFDLLLLDVLLPGLDGYSIARQWRADPSTASIPLIFVTSLAAENEVVKGFEAGGVDFVTKPYHQGELLHRLRTHLTLKDRTEALEATAAELREANQTRDRFFSVLAHDLRNPFAGFLSLADEAVAQYDRISAPEMREILTTMASTAQNVYRLLDNLLDWGRAQTGALALDPQVLPVSLVVDEALEPLAEGFRRKGVDLEVGLGPEEFRVDRATVTIIIRNLLSNALKFTPQGGKVTISGALQGGRTWLRVKDTGVGIPSSRLQRLFKVEEKVTTPGTDHELGTGLGLVLCAEFARRNGGSITVSSTPGQGSEFCLELPGP